MVKYRNLSEKYYSHISEATDVIDLNLFENFTKENVICLNQYLDRDYIFKNKLYKNPVLFKANINSFDEEFLLKCFGSLENLADNTKAITTAIKTQNVSQDFIIKILDMAEAEKSIDLYYEILEVSSGYVKLSEGFIKEYILDDDNASESMLTKVISYQELSEEFIEENLIEWLEINRYWLEDDEEKWCKPYYGWKFLFSNPNAHISEWFFEKHDLMRLNLAYYILYNDTTGKSIDLSHFSFAYLYRIFKSACHDVPAYQKDEDISVDDYHSAPIFRAFGYEFALKIFREKMTQRNFPITRLYPYESYPFDKLLSDFFESFTVDEDTINMIESDFDKITDFIYSNYNDNSFYEDAKDRRNCPLFCWWICGITQKVTHSLLFKIIRYGKMYKNYFDKEDLPVNPYLNEDHIYNVIRACACDLFDYKYYFDDYEFDFDEDISGWVKLEDIAVTNLGNLEILKSYSDLVFKSNAFDIDTKYDILRDILQNQYNIFDNANPDGHKFIIDYVTHHFDKDSMIYSKSLAYIIAYLNLKEDTMESILSEIKW